ncbi:hypothetical protein C6B38_04995 [Spiroplasma sp. ChiS]|uniref:hypothetical protein n=1 Tax=Spiroplasma sp. ChiS TaxID=2099885 RepID=UPI000CF903CA|nr:hypothetical protein [Spiroplasma sp. ChiS]PQP78600.1 hypothetical protein C6B38_04995 [Spiroplasma sp. ChiS]
MNVTELIKFNKLKEENEKLKNELAEKESRYFELKNRFDNLLKYYEEFSSQQLYKEDFDDQYYCSYHGHWDQCIVEDEEEPTEEQLSKYILILKDNSKYDKLPSIEKLIMEKNLEELENENITRFN